MGTGFVTRSAVGSRTRTVQPTPGHNADLMLTIDGGVRASQLLVIRAGLTPRSQRAGSDQHDISDPEFYLLPGGRGLQILRADGGSRWQDINSV